MDRQNEVIRLYIDGYRIKRIMDETGYSEQGIYSILRRHGVPARNGKHASPNYSNDAIILARWCAISLKEAQRRLNLNANTTTFITAQMLIDSGHKLSHLAAMQTETPPGWFVEIFGEPIILAGENTIDLSWLDVLRLLTRPRAFFQELQEGE